MPYVSEAQRGKFHAMEERGEISPKTVKEWDKASKGKKLPKHVKKAAELGFALGYTVCAPKLEKSALDILGPEDWMNALTEEGSPSFGEIIADIVRKKHGAETDQPSYLNRQLAMVEALHHPRFEAVHKRFGATPSLIFAASPKALEPYLSPEKQAARGYGKQSSVGQVKEGGIATLLGRLGTTVQRGARAAGKPLGVDPLAWMRHGADPAINAARAKALGALTAGTALYGGYRMLGSGGRPQQPPQPRPQYIQATPYYPMGMSPY